jgi:hypothetical protein
VKLGTLLLRNAAIGLSQLEAALRNQVLYGGRLGTNLVELGFLDLETLSVMLAEMSGSPIATPSLLDAADKELLDKLPGDDAHRLRALPLTAYTEKAAIGVAMVDPADKDAIEELAQRFGKKIAPHVVPELRALYYLEKHYGLPRRARFVRSGRRPSEPPDNVDQERRRQQPSGGMVMPPAFTLEPRRRRTTSGQPVRAPVPPEVAYGAACERIDIASDREQIADALVAYAKGRLDALVVFLIRDGNALGWRGYVAPGPTEVVGKLDELSLPLGGASALQSAHDTCVAYNGMPPSAARPVETKLWVALAASPDPVEVAVVPIVVKQRAVNLIYAHVLGAGVPKEIVTELGDLAARASQSYMRLIRQTRGS